MTYSASHPAGGPSWCEAWDIGGTVTYLRKHGFTRVTLQFPDELLEQSTVVCASIAEECASQQLSVQVSILADTTYNSLNVDEVAAQHAQADCVIHYGRASMSLLSTLPAYFVFGQQPLNVATTAERIADFLTPQDSQQKTVLVFLDQLLLHAASQLQAHVQLILQTRQQTAQVLYAEVQARSMEPSDTLSAPSQPAGQAKAISHAGSSCCQLPGGSPCKSSQTAGDAQQQQATARPQPVGSADAAQAVAAGNPDCHSTLPAPSQQASSNAKSNTFLDIRTSDSQGCKDPAAAAALPPTTLAAAAEQQAGDVNAARHEPAASQSQAAAAQVHADAEALPGADRPRAEGHMEQIADRSSNTSCLGAGDNVGRAAAAPPDADGPDHSEGRAAESGAGVPGDNAPEAARASLDAGTSDAEGAEGSVRQIAGYSWRLPAGLQQEDVTMVWVGPPQVAALTHLQLTFNKSHWAMYDPGEDEWQEGLPTHISRTLKRRYFLVEKAKNANVIGILVGTLGVAGYRDAIDSIRNMAKQAGKKTYTMLMGKPSPAKLANLPEVEVFVMVADPQGMILDSKEYYAPIITPFEAYLAFFGEAEWDGSYSLDFTSLQSSSSKSKAVQRQPRFSFLDGSYHSANGNDSQVDDEANHEGASTALATRAQHALQVSGSQTQVLSASDYLQKRRTYRGLEAPVVGAEAKPVVKAVQGQTGRAAHYSHEDAS